jgi:hypothetical protein
LVAITRGCALGRDRSRSGRQIRVHVFGLLLCGLPDGRRRERDD